MASTRINNDSARISKFLQQSTDQGRWVLDTPGNGDKPCFILDPQIIPQKWGGNLWTNVTDINSHLLGIDKRLNKDNINQKPYKRSTIETQPIIYPVCDDFLTTEQSRSIMPAWTARDLPQHRGHILSKNPQEQVNIPFANNVSTRILEKDNFKNQEVPRNSQLYTHTK